MPTKLELLEQTIEHGFPIGEDVPTALADPDRVERLKRVADEVCTEDVVVEMVGDENFRQERRGVDGFLDAWLDWIQPFETFRVEIEDMTDTGPCLLILVRQIGRPRGADTEIENEGAAVWMFEGDRVARVEFHLDREVAMRAAGLDPDRP
jgi:ketosteroid isomerase-like protein